MNSNFRRRVILPPPHFIVGHRSLTSQVWRIALDQKTTDYRFDLRRHAGWIDHHRIQLFRPSELPDFIALIRVLIQELLHDGGLQQPLRQQLRELLGHLHKLPGADEDEHIHADRAADPEFPNQADDYRQCLNDF